MQLKNKWVITTDSLCEGITADKDERGRIILYAEDDAARSVMDSWLMIQEARNDEIESGFYAEDDPEDIPYHMKPKDLAAMGKLASEGTAAQIIAFWDKHPDMDDSGFGWEPAQDFIDGRKAIWTQGGGHLEGRRIQDLEVIDENEISN